MTTRALWHPESGRVSRRLKSVALTLVASMALLLSGLVVAPERAEAATDGAVGSGVTITPAGYGDMWLGAFEPPDGGTDLAWCIQGRVYTSAGSTPTGESFAEDGPLAYVIGKFGGIDEQNTRAAIAYLVHMRHEVSGGLAGGDVEAAKVLIDNATPAAVKSRAAELLAEGEGQGGPYTANAGPTTGSGTRHGSIKHISWKSDAGAYITGIAWTAVLVGADGAQATFDANGQTTISGVTIAGEIEIAWTARHTGDITPQVKFFNVPRRTVTVFDTAGNRQSVLSYGNRNGTYDPEEVDVDLPPFRAVADFLPNLSTVAQRLNDSGSLIDTVSVGLRAGDSWPTDGAGNPLTLITRHTVIPAGLQPFAQTPTIPSVAALGTEFISWTAPGTRSTSGSIARPAAGFASWVDEIRISDQTAAMAELIPADRRSSFMVEAETTSVRHQVVHTSEMREFNVAANGRAFDTVTIGGFPADHGSFTGLGGWQADVQTSTVTVYGPLASMPTTAAVQAGWPVLTAVTLPAKNGIYQVGYTDADKISPSLPGYYVAVYTFAGDSRVMPIATAANDVREMFYVPTAGSWIDVASTATQNATAGQGVMSDTVLVSGNAVPPGSTATWEKCLWVDPAEPGCADPQVTYSTTVNGPGFYLHPEIPVLTVADLPPGTMTAYYGWSVTLTSPSGQVLDREPFGVESQTTTITAIPPVMTSQATEEAGPGDPASDTLTLDGPTRADWTLQWELCWLTNGVCADGSAFTLGDPQQIDPAQDTYTFELPDGVQVPDGTAPGSQLTLGWAPVIRDVDGDEVAREAWGAPGQTTTVDYPLPTMTSKATATGSLDGTTQDVVEVTGPVLAGSRIAWPGCYLVAAATTCAEGSTPVAPGPVQADGSVGIVLPALAVGETLEVTGPEHTLTAGGLLPTPDLRFSWTPIITSPEGNALVSEAPGVPAQTTVVEFPPVTVVSEAYSTSGGPFYGDGVGDRLTSTGDVFPGDKVTVRLYAWPVGSAPVCDGEPLAEKVVELTASTSTYDTGVIYQTPEERTDLVYGFQHTTTSRGTDVVSECGLTAETLVMSASASASARASRLATTGMRNLGLLWFAGTFIAVGGAMVSRSHAQKKQKKQGAAA